MTDNALGAVLGIGFWAICGAAYLLWGFIHYKRKWLSERGRVDVEHSRAQSYRADWMAAVDRNKARNAAWDIERDALRGLKTQAELDLVRGLEHAAHRAAKDSEHHVLALTQAYEKEAAMGARLAESEAWATYLFDCLVDARLELAFPDETAAHDTEMG